mmetsp:Transcript_8491/g.17629  ORF Transcript_8491/g.17629 Transcript_8491/m.17629 type:complete len:88 (-) Transcript_8491:15-278(-)
MQSFKDTRPCWGISQLPQLILLVAYGCIENSRDCSCCIGGAMVEEDNKLDAGVTRTVETIMHEYCSKAIPYQRTTSLEGVIVSFFIP